MQGPKLEVQSVAVFSNCLRAGSQLLCIVPLDGRQVGHYFLQVGQHSRRDQARFLSSSTLRQRGKMLDLGPLLPVP